MDIFGQALGEIAGRRVLDVATGQGGFVELLMDKLGSYEQIVGIDLSERMIADAAHNVDRADAHFVQMDAGHLGFGDGCFDTVALSASLHHLPACPPVLAEIERVLRPGGHLVVAEMHRDGQTEPELTSVALHHWAAGIDLALGLPHYPTLTRQEIVALIEALAFSKIQYYDWSDRDSDPKEPERLSILEGVFERYLQKAKDLADYPILEEQAKALCQRLQKVGAQSEPRILIVASSQ